MTSDGTVLVIDDEKNIRRSLKLILEGQGYSTRTAATAGEALNILNEDTIDVIVLDIKLPDKDGLELLEHLRRDLPKVPILIISGHGSIADAIKAIKLGAYNYIEKPIDRDTFLAHVRNCLEKITLEREIELLKTDVNRSIVLVGDSEPIVKLRLDIERVARSKAKVLITGESGTGKELVAREIHHRSSLSHQPFVKVNCAAIPLELIESELFGHARGAFTGAAAARRGKFELADKGTIFLDEIGDMSLPAQAKVLRLLQTGELTRVGDEQPRAVDVRIIAATNKDLPKLIGEKKFREDLYFRINVLAIHTPPLREHVEDIPQLARGFIAHYCAENGLRVRGITPAAIKLLQAYSWPGNVRELRNLIERLVILGGEPIDVGDLPVPMGMTTEQIDVATYAGVPLKDAVRKAEKDIILSNLESTGWNVSQTAEVLGLERSHLHRKMKQYDLQRRRKNK